MPDGGGDRIVQCKTVQLELKTNQATITLGITDDEGLLRKIVDSLEKYSTDALRAMLDGKPFEERLDLRFIRDKRNGTSEELTEDQTRYYIKAAIEERERAEGASVKPEKPLWLKFMRGAIWPIVSGLIIVAAAKLFGLA